MWLEHGEHAAGGERPRRRNHRRDLGRVVRVVVVHRRARSRLSEMLEPPPGTAKRGERLGRPLAVRARERRRRQRAGGIDCVVGAGDPQHHRDTTPCEDRAGGAQPSIASVVRRRLRWAQGAQLRAVPDDRLVARACHERSQRLLEVEARGVRRMVIELGVRQHRDLGRRTAAASDLIRQPPR